MAAISSNYRARSAASSRRSTSPSGCLCSSFPRAPPSSAFASSFSSRPTTFFQRSASPTRVNLVGSSSSRASSICFAVGSRPTSPGRSFAVASTGDGRSRPGHRHYNQVVKRPIAASGGSTVDQKRTCACSPSTHPGSFRCSLHRTFATAHHASSSPSSRLNARRSAMTNSLVRIGTVEGEWVRRALTALIRPSSHQQRRRAAFRPRPSRLSVMSKANDLR